MVLEPYSLLHTERAHALQTEMSAGPRTARLDYAEALDLLQADAVVFEHKLAAADWSGDASRSTDMRQLFDGLRRTAQALNRTLEQGGGFAGRAAARPGLAEAFGRPRLYGTAPRRSPVERAEDAVDDTAYLNGALRVTAHLAMSAGDMVMASALSSRADELEGFGWVLAAGLH